SLPRAKSEPASGIFSASLAMPSRVARCRPRPALLLRTIRIRLRSRARVLALITAGLGRCLARLSAADLSFLAHRAGSTRELLLLARLLLRGAREEAGVRAHVGCLRLARVALASRSFVAT